MDLPLVFIIFPGFILLFLSHVGVVATGSSQAEGNKVPTSSATVLPPAKFSATAQEQQTTPSPAQSSGAQADLSPENDSSRGESGGIMLKGDVSINLELQDSLRFEPPIIDFGVWSVGVAKSQKVTLVNHNTKSVYLSSVSGRTPTFYSSFFESKVIPPHKNTTFNVVFLPRQNGAVSTDLLIHTSFGQARLSVRGEGVECPFRLKPLVGIRAPFMATLMPEIYMHNPHDYPLQIVEVYSSGGQFQLELPSGEHEAPQALWEIPPHTTKSVIRIRFSGNSVGNHAAYIRIKITAKFEENSPQDSGNSTSTSSTTSTVTDDNVLVVPVEFEIEPNQGIYAVNPILDFGRLTGNSKSSLQLKLNLRDSALSDAPDEEPFKNVADEVEMQLDHTITGLNFDSKDASLTLDPQKFPATSIVDEVFSVRVTSKPNATHRRPPQDFSILVRAEVFKGRVTFLPAENVTLFVTGSKGYRNGEKRQLRIRNDLELPLTLLNVSIDLNDTSIMRMHIDSAFKSGVVLAPGAFFTLLHLQPVNESAANFRTQLNIYTNVTNLKLPIVISSGRLHVSTHETMQFIPSRLPYSLNLNMGAIPLAEMSQDGYIILQNRNPLPVKLSNWDFQSPQGIYFHTTFTGCLRAASTFGKGHKDKDDGEMPIKIEPEKFKLCSHLNEGDLAVFRVAIQSYITEERTGSLKIWTPYEMIEITVHFSTWLGKLEVDQEQLYFKNCFPGKMCSSDLSLRSTFLEPIHITGINFSDAGLRFQEFSAKSLIVAPEALTRVGRIYFEPAKLCHNRCYIPVNGKLSTNAFPKPQDTKGGANNNLHFDELELRRRTELFRQLKWYFRTISFTLSSREVRRFQLQLIIDIEWPKLVPSGKQRLPTIEVGKHQEYELLITNPASTPIMVDYYLADPKYARQTKLSLPLEVVDISASCFLTDKPVFSLLGQSGGSKLAMPQEPLLIPAGERTKVLVKFEPQQQNADTYCTLLHIRNNLTLYEAVWLSARTVLSQFRFGNRKPGSNTPLLFEVNEKHLAACQQMQPVVTKRTFTARNTGELPIWVDSFYIDDQKCEGYGFKVLGCESFELPANGSRKVEIAFSPDFTATRVTRPLILRTNLSYDVNYVLRAHLPHAGIEECTAGLSRPHWEKQARIGALILLVITLVFVLVAAHVDFENIIRGQSTIYMARERGPVHPTFNLRNIAMKAMNTATLAGDEYGAAPTSAKTSSVSAAGGSSILPSFSSKHKGSNYSHRHGTVSSETDGHMHLKKRGTSGHHHQLSSNYDGKGSAASRRQACSGGGSSAGIGKNMALSDALTAYAKETNAAVGTTISTKSERHNRSLGSPDNERNKQGCAKNTMRFHESEALEKPLNSKHAYNKSSAGVSDQDRAEKSAQRSQQQANTAFSRALASDSSMRSTALSPTAMNSNQANTSDKRHAAHNGGIATQMPSHKCNRKSKNQAERTDKEDSDLTTSLPKAKLGGSVPKTPVTGHSKQPSVEKTKPDASAQKAEKRSPTNENQTRQINETIGSGGKVTPTLAPAAGSGPVGQKFGKTPGRERRKDKDKEGAVASKVKTLLKLETNASSSASCDSGLASESNHSATPNISSMSTSTSSNCSSTSSLSSSASVSSVSSSSSANAKNAVATSAAAASAKANSQALRRQKEKKSNRASAMTSPAFDMVVTTTLAYTLAANQASSMSYNSPQSLITTNSTPSKMKPSAIDVGKEPMSSSKAYSPSWDTNRDEPLVFGSINQASEMVSQVPRASSSNASSAANSGLDAKMAPRSSDLLRNNWFNELEGSLQKAEYENKRKSDPSPSLETINANSYFTIPSQMENQLLMNSSHMPSSPLSNELGPIGSKRSPTSTPAWIDNAFLATKALINSEHAARNIATRNSLFSSVSPSPTAGGNSAMTSGASDSPKMSPTANLGMASMPMAAPRSPAFVFDGSNVGEAAVSNGTNAGHQIITHPLTGFYDGSKLPADHLDFLLGLRQLQQRKHLQQLQQLQEHERQQMMQGVNQWPSSMATSSAENTWPPIMTSGVNGNAGVGLVSSNAFVSAGMGRFAWPRATGGPPTVFRPPPGLEAAAPMQNMQNMLHRSQLQHPQPQQQQQQPPQQQQQQEMQAFDPFSALSSIWSDDWRKSGAGAGGGRGEADGTDRPNNSNPK